jgi:hypothetical protein
MDIEAPNNCRNDEEDINNPTLYTDREMSMHVSGPKDFCDTFVLHNYGDSQLSYEEANEFYENGFFCVENQVSHELIAKARSYINDQYKAWLKESKRQDDWRIHLMLDFDKLSDEPVEHAPVLDLVIQSPGILQRLENLMDTKPAGCFYNQIAYRTPLVNYKSSVLDYTVGAEYHLDGTANASGTRFPDPWTVLVGIALVDIDALDLGNFTVFPGYHKNYCWKNYSKEKKTKTLPSLGEPTKIRLKAGSVVFVHLLLPHRGGKNIHSAEDIEESNYENLPNIPKGTREFSLFRIRGKNIAYEDIARSERVLSDPWYEHRGVLEILGKCVRIASST